MGAFSITAVDVLVIIVVLVSAVFAMWRGLIHETFTIFEWIAGGLVALRFSPSFQPLLKDVVSPPWLAMVVVFIGTFLIVFIPLSILANRLSEMVKKSEIGPVDRVLGLVFGVARGLVLVGGAYLLYDALVPEREQAATVTRSALFPVIRDASDVLRSFLPSRGGDSEDRREPPARATAVQGAERAQTGGAAAATPRATAAPANTNAETAAKNTTTTDRKSYGANDRRALDSLIEATGGGNAPR